MGKTPEFKHKIGERAMNSDGFTYCYGKFDEYSNDHRHKELIARCRRSDKRSVKGKELKRMLNED